MNNPPPTLPAPRVRIHALSGDVRSGRELDLARLEFPSPTHVDQR